MRKNLARTIRKTKKKGLKSAEKRDQRDGGNSAGKRMPSLPGVLVKENRWT